MPLVVGEEAKTGLPGLASLPQQDIAKIVEDKNSQTQKGRRHRKVAKELFADHVKDKKLREPEVFLHV